MTIPIDMLIQKGKNLTGVPALDKEVQATNDCWEGEFVSPKGDPLDWLSSTTWSALKSYPYKQQKQIHQVLSALVGMDMSSSYFSVLPFVLFILFYEIHSGELSFISALGKRLTPVTLFQC